MILRTRMKQKLKTSQITLISDVLDPFFRFVTELSLVPVFKPNTGTIFSNEELDEFEGVEVRALNSPVDFAKHASGTTNIQNWRTKIWVDTRDNERIKISDTCLLKYYKEDSYERPCNKTTHCDEFLQCKACKKLRRFKLECKEECRIYHDLVANKDRTCSDMGCNKHTLCETLQWFDTTIGTLYIGYM
ncbi:hypothetical protein CTI12_AA456560 [Artemisia annua]|uniref:Uncharacterized protein n=1 Tax=Artemisia annua TaxID=35608 RepID=A0A2U1LRY8_ARTAN|nr:hypothetical protein CTI12_AA456560 [Artemisia annua]